MQKPLNYNFILTLKEMAFARIAVELCCEPGFLKLSAEFEFSYASCHRADIFPYVNQILSKLRLPESLKKQMRPIVHAVVDEILRWKLYHQKLLNLEMCALVLQKLHWTTAGTVDYRETAEELVRCDLLDVVKRFQFACFYCLEDFIPVFWKELSDEDKKIFYDGDVLQIQEPHLQLFLPKILEKGESELGRYELFSYFYDDDIKRCCERAAVLGNKTLVNYCLGKLTETERGGFLVRAASNVIRYQNILKSGMYEPVFIKGRLLSEVACHLLSQLTAEEEIGIFKEVPCQVFRCFLNWPYQALFLDVADKIWTFLPESKYEDLLRGLAGIFFLNMGYHFPNLIQEFFLRSPVNFRKCFVDHQECLGYGRFMVGLIDQKDTETIGILLRNLEAVDRVRLVFSEWCLFLIYTSDTQWPVLEVFFREATLTKEQKQKLKVTFTEYAKGSGRTELEICRDYRWFFEFVDEDDADTQRKRSLEDEKLTGVKKLCSERKKNFTH